MPNLTNVQKRLIRRYVKKLVSDELRMLRDYYDVDQGLELRAEVVRRLRGSSSKKNLSHEEFWAKATK